MRMHSLLPGAAMALSACTATMSPPARPAPAPGPAGRGNAATVHVLGVPPGHLPRPGQCRVWIPGVPPGRQARSRACAGIMATAPSGSWVLYRPSADRHYVHVRVVDPVRTGVLVMVRIFIAADGRFVTEREPGDADRDDDGRGRGRRPDQRR